MFVLRGIDVTLAKLSQPWPGLLVSSLLVAAIVSAALSVKYGRRLRLEERRRRSKIVGLHDLQEREFVLYLRSFTDDVAGSRLVGVGGLSMEEQFVRTLNQFGPVMTIGSPGEAQPHAGAYRLYLDNTSWQQSVEQLLEKAKLVVIRTGLSSGLHWEIERVVRRVSPQRVLMVVDDKVEMRRCLECVRNVHSQVSPSVNLGWRRVCGVRGLLVFDEQWRVSKLRLRGRGIYAPRSRNFLEPGLARSLYPLFQTLGVEWPRPSLDWLLALTRLPVFLLFYTLIAILVVRVTPAGSRTRRAIKPHQPPAVQPPPWGLLLLEIPAGHDAYVEWNEPLSSCRSRRRPHTH